jgi:hypothetical protein
MMNMNKALPVFSILYTEIDPASSTIGAVMRDACVSVTTIMLIAIYKKLSSLSFLELKGHQ